MMLLSLLLPARCGAHFRHAVQFRPQPSSVFAVAGAIALPRRSPPRAAVTAVRPSAVTRFRAGKRCQRGVAPSGGPLIHASVTRGASHAMATPLEERTLVSAPRWHSCGYASSERDGAPQNRRSASPAGNRRPARPAALQTVFGVHGVSTA